MENSRTVSSKRNAKIKCAVYPGHFATNHSHINYYVDLTAVKTQCRTARLAAKELARDFASIPVNTIICLEGTEMIGAFIADDLSQSQSVVHFEEDIHVLTPEMNANNQLIFRENTQEMVMAKSILLLVSTASTGKTITQALECIQYYDGHLTGICTLFSAVDQMEGVPVHSVFSVSDIPDYLTYTPGQCAMCERKERIDAIANSFGYSRL